MTFVLYSNNDYEYMVDAFIKSTIYAKLDLPILYYTIGFNSTLDYPNLTKIYFEPITDKINFNYYKPNILKDSLKYIETACFMDSDILLSRRFSVDIFENKDLEYPLSCLGPEQYPYVYWTNGQESLSFDDSALRDYFNIGPRSMGYLWSCQISYNRKCEDFIDEWLSICDNKYLLNKGKVLGHKEYFPFTDETAYNVTLWKRKVNNHLGYKFLNTANFETFNIVENSENISNQYFDNLYGLVENSNSINFYHGFKEKNDLNKVTNWMREQSN